MLYIFSFSADQSGELRVTTHLLSVLTQLASLGQGSEDLTHYLL